MGKLQLKHSAVEGKKPQPTDLDYGEIAINFNANQPFLSIKDTNDQIRTFSTGGGIGEEHDPVWEAEKENYYTKTEIDDNAVLEKDAKNNIKEKGSSSVFTGGVHNVVFGDENKVNSGRYNFVSGWNNVIDESTNRYNQILGNTNTIQGGFENQIFGRNNTLTNSSIYCQAIGGGNTIDNCEKVTAIGRDFNIKDLRTDDTTVFIGDAVVDWESQIGRIGHVNLCAGGVVIFSAGKNGGINIGDTTLTENDLKELLKLIGK